MLNTFLRLLSAIVVAVLAAACATTTRPPLPEYQGTVQVMNQEFPVNVDTCGNDWLLVTTENLYKVIGHGTPLPLYRGVNNVPDAMIARHGDTVYATSAKEGVLRSDNGGRTFVVMPNTTGVGKPRTICHHAGRIIIADQQGKMRSVGRAGTWAERSDIDSVLAVFDLQGNIIVVQEHGSVRSAVGDEPWKPLLHIATPTSETFDWSVFRSTAVMVSDRTLYRIRVVGNALRVDSTQLPETGWRQVSCYGEDIVLMRGRNEIWWGTFDEPLAARVPMEGRFDQRVVNLELSSIGLVAGQRGTEHSLWWFIKNATTWEPLRTPDGLPVTEVLWLQRADTSLHIGTREGGFYTLDDRRLAVQKMAGNGPLMNILRHVGSGERSAISLIDGTILQVDQCGASPQPIDPPIPFRNGLQAMGWFERFFVHDAVDGLFARNDNADEWKRIPLPSEMQNLEAIYEINGRIYAYALMGLWSTIDDGRTWSRSIDASDTVYAVRNSGRDLLIFSTTGWYWVDDGKVRGELQLPTDVRGSRSLNYETAGDVVAVFTEKLLYVSNDRGSRWTTFEIAKESPFTEVRIVNDRIFGFVPQTGLLMFDVYDDRAPRTP